MAKKKKKLYVVVHGRVPGLYQAWSGKGGAQEQVDQFPGAIYKGFYTREEALQWLKDYDRERLLYYAPDLVDLIGSEPAVEPAEDLEDAVRTGKVILFTDGGAVNNPGPGGYGVVMRDKAGRRELSGGYRKTTNNRMEIMACITGLKALPAKSEVILYSDSKYVVDSMTLGWARRWRANGWKRDKKKVAENHDLWEQLLALTEQHDVEFRWLRGHAGQVENERCDQLARQAALESDLPPDVGYENPDQINMLPFLKNSLE